MGYISVSTHKSEAEELLSAFGHGEVVASLNAQDDYVGRKVTRELGLEVHLLKMRRSEPLARARLQKLGQKLGWEKRTVESGTLPSVGYIAKQIGQTKLYNLLYHPTSRFVHFSTSELLRRGLARSPFAPTILASIGQRLPFTGAACEHLRRWRARLRMKCPKICSMPNPSCVRQRKSPITALYQLLRRPSSHGSQMRPIPALNRTPACGPAPARRSPVSLLR